MKKRSSAAESAEVQGYKKNNIPKKKKYMKKMRHILLALAMVLCVSVPASAQIV